jgi:hypothetical protein
MVAGETRRWGVELWRAFEWEEGGKVDIRDGGSGVQASIFWLASTSAI